MEHLLGSRSNDSDRSEFLGEREGAEDMAEEVSCKSIADPNISADTMRMSDGGP